MGDISREVETSSKLGDGTVSKQQQIAESLSQDFKFLQLGIEKEERAREEDEALFAAEAQEEASDAEVQEEANSKDADHQEAASAPSASAQQAIHAAAAAVEPLEEHERFFAEARAAHRARKQHHEAKRQARRLEAVERRTARRESSRNPPPRRSRRAQRRQAARQEQGPEASLANLWAEAESAMDSQGGGAIEEVAVAAAAAPLAAGVQQEARLDTLEEANLKAVMAASAIEAGDASPPEEAEEVSSSSSSEDEEDEEDEGPAIEERNSDEMAWSRSPFKPSAYPQLGAPLVLERAASAKAGPNAEEDSQPSMLARTVTTPAAETTVAPQICNELFSRVFAQDAQDPQLVAQYASEVHAMYVEKERLYLSDPDYMATQANINGRMRAILLDWLFDVHLRHRMRTETFFLAVNITDRYLALKQVPRRRLQLLGVVAIFIASKYEDIDPPKVREMAYMTDNTYTTNEIIQMESVVLNVLEHDVAGTTAAHVFERLQRVNRCDATQRKLTLYALTLAALDLRFLRYTPSHLVSAALLIGNEITDRSPVWSGVLAHHTGYSFDSLQACVADLGQTMASARTANLQAVRRFYLNNLRRLQI